MSLADDRDRSNGRLNMDIFAAVVDEVIGWLNRYKRYDIIQFAGVMRLVCRYADSRIRPIALRYLDIISPKQLSDIAIRAEAGEPNPLCLRSLTLRTMYPLNSIGRYLFRTSESLAGLQSLTFDDHASPSERPEYDNISFVHAFPTSVTDLSYIPAPGSFTEKYGTTFDCAEYELPCVRRLAMFGVVPVPRLELPVLEDLVLSVGAAQHHLEKLMWEVKRQCRLLKLRRLRLIFISEDDTSQLTEDQKRSLASNFPANLVVEEIQLVEDDKATWFADRVEDGAIWTIPGVNLRD